MVIMDDIDRLTADEIRDLFRLLKAVGDLPNILYMISMDRDMVVKALGDVQGTPGDSYLEKIVQYSFDLPQPDKLLLRQLLFARLDDVLAGMTEDEFDRTYYSNVYYEGIDHFITRPRDVVRLCNSLIVAYPAVKSEINAVDLIAIESLRVFQPSVYSILRSNPEMFAGHSGNLYRGSSGGIEEFHNAWLETIDDNDRKPIKRMMIRLFPKLEIVWGNDHHYGPDWEATWRKERRVCSPEVFPIYFRMATPSGSISNAEMKAMLKLIATPEAFAERLKDLAKQTLPSGRTRVRAFLELLPDYVDEYVSGSAIQRFVNVVFAVGDDLQKQEDEVGMFEVGNGIRILRVVFQLLKPLSEAERYATLLAAISQGKALTTMIRVVASLLKERAEQGKEPAPEEDVFLTEEHQESLKSVLLEKIRTAVAANSYVLFSHPDILWTLHRWKDWAGVAEPRKWVQDCIVDDGWLMLLLAHSVEIGSRQSIDDVVPTPTTKLDAEWLSDFLDPSAIADRLRNILANKGVPSGSGAERAMRLFIASCEGTDQDD